MLRIKVEYKYGEYRCLHCNCYNRLKWSKCWQMFQCHNCKKINLKLEVEKFIIPSYHIIDNPTPFQIRKSNKVED